MFVNQQIWIVGLENILYLTQKGFASSFTLSLAVLRSVILVPLFRLSPREQSSRLPMSIQSGICVCLRGGIHHESNIKAVHYIFEIQYVLRQSNLYGPVHEVIQICREYQETYVSLLMQITDNYHTSQCGS